MALSKKKIASEQCFQETLAEVIQNTEFLSLDKYVQHGRTSVLQHSIAVAQYSIYLAHLFHIRVNEREMIRGALLHDYFLYDWHEKDSSHKWHGFTHPTTALKNAMKVCDLSDRERDIIKKHMFPLTPFLPRYRESYLVCIADKVCSSYETLYLCSELKTYEHGEKRFSLCMKSIERKRARKEARIELVKKAHEGLLINEKEEEQSYGFDGIIKNETNISAV